MPLYLNLVQKDTNGNIICSILFLSHELKAEITFTGIFSLLFVINIIIQVIIIGLKRNWYMYILDPALCEFAKGPYYY